MKILIFGGLVLLIRSPDNFSQETEYNFEAQYTTFKGHGWKDAVDAKFTILPLPLAANYPNDNTIPTDEIVYVLGG